MRFLIRDIKLKLVFHFHQAIRCSRLLPSLHQECTSCDSVATALPPLVSLVQHSSSEEFSQHVFPEITFVFNCSMSEQVRNF